MRGSLRLSGLCAVLLVAACRDTLVVGTPPAAPQNLAYELEPSGDPTKPAGILLAWDDVPSQNLGNYRVYSRGSTGSSYGLRGETTSNTFHDNGVPHLQYYVTAVNTDGAESAPSNSITVNEFLQIERPQSLSSVSLNQAIHLSWTDNAYTSDPGNFKWYRVYSTSYDLDAQPPTCGATWSLEGTTVAPEFLAGALSNGVPRCFGVSAISVNGFESLWSPLWQDTPRPDARNLLVWAGVVDPTRTGFRFWSDANNDGVGQASELGLVASNSDPQAIDFSIVRGMADTMWIRPEFSGTRIRLYSTSPVADLTNIDFAQASGYTRNLIQAVPGYGYVFEIVEGTTLHYGAVRVTHVGRDYVIFDWSFQTDPGNPELIVRGNLPTTSRTGFGVKGSN